MRNILRSVFAVALLAVAALAMPRMALAWHENEYTANGKPQFNIYTGVDGIGDEHDFVRVGATDGNIGTLNNNFNVCDGQAMVWVYIHNGAPELYNGTNNDGTGVAHDTRLAVNLPTVASKTATITGAVSARDVTPINNNATITCGSDEVVLEYVPGSAKLYSVNQGVVALSDDVVKSGGTLVGSLANNGVVPGCWDFRAFVQMTVKVKKVAKPAPVQSATCDAVEKITVSGRKATMTGVKHTELNGASFVKYLVNWGDNTAVESYNEADFAKATHTYAADGTWNVVVSTVVKINGTDTTITSNGCKQTVTTKAVTGTLSAVTTLPNTGAGNMVGAFVGVSVLGAAAHNLIARRRLGSK